MKSGTTLCENERDSQIKKTISDKMKNEIKKSKGWLRIDDVVN